jgi:type VI protein secretion system component VasF
MYWRLTPEERRIIERTRREGAEINTTPDQGRGRLWRSVAVWVGGIALLVFFAWLMVWIGSLL